MLLASRNERKQLVMWVDQRPKHLLYMCSNSFKILDARPPRRLSLSRFSCQRLPRPLRVPNPQFIYQRPCLLTGISPLKRTGSGINGSAFEPNLSINMM